MPTNRKPDAIRRNKPAELDPRAYVDLVVPDPPDVDPELVEWWHRFFGSELAQAVYQPTDEPALRRLVELYQLRNDAYRIASETPTVRGGNNQITAHPLLKQITVYDSAIDRLEDRFGLTPRARLNLGLVIAEGTKRIEDLSNHSAVPEVVEPEVDPRDFLEEAE